MPRDPSSVLWLVLSAALVATLYSTHFLPFYDYYQWLFQGHVVSVLLFGADAGASGITDSYSLSPVPVPNLAAPILIGALDTLLPTEAAGQLFVVLTALGFALAFGYLVRTLQQRPTAIEYLGFPWATGFFLYKGYLSFLFGLALLFVLTATLHRMVARATGPDRRTLVGVSGLVTVLYLSHMVAWVIGGLAVVLHALVLARSGRRPPARLLLLTVLPGVAMAVWYVLAERGGTGITLYPSLFDKAIALTETLQFFLRLDPFPPVFPIFWINLLVASAFAVLVLRHLDRPALRAAVTTRPVLWLSALLFGTALLLPVSMVNDLIKPDERFVLPALLLAVAALPYRAVRLRAAAPAAVLVALVLGLHLVEYTDVGRRIGRVDAATDAVVPAGTPVLHLAIPSRYGCTPSAGPSIGVPVLKWFAVDHALEAGPTQVNINETSLVQTRDPGRPGITVLAPALPDVPAAVLPPAPTYPYVQTIACPSALAEIEQTIAPTYRPIAHGEGYTIFQRSHEPQPSAQRAVHHQAGGPKRQDARRAAAGLRRRPRYDARPGAPKDRLSVGGGIGAVLRSAPSPMTGPDHRHTVGARRTSMVYQHHRREGVTWCGTQPGPAAACADRAGRDPARHDDDVPRRPRVLGAGTARSSSPCRRRPTPWAPGACRHREWSARGIRLRGGYRRDAPDRWCRGI